MPRRVVKPGAIPRLRRRCKTSVDTVARTRQRLVERAGGYPDSQAFGEFGEVAHRLWGGRGQVDHVGVFQTAGRPSTLDIATAGRSGRRTDDHRTRQRQHDQADAEKNLLKPHLKQRWVIPPDANAAFVAAMENMLEVYQRPYDPQRPLACLDGDLKVEAWELTAPGSTPGPTGSSQPRTRG
jgi:hypothetical protein